MPPSPRGGAVERGHADVPARRLALARRDARGRSASSARSVNGIASRWFAACLSLTPRSASRRTRASACRLERLGPAAPADARPARSASASQSTSGVSSAARPSRRERRRAPRRAARWRCSRALQLGDHDEVGRDRGDEPVERGLAAAVAHDVRAGERVRRPRSARPAVPAVGDDDDADHPQLASGMPACWGRVACCASASRRQSRTSAQERMLGLGPLAERPGATSWPACCASHSKTGSRARRVPAWR